MIYFKEKNRMFYEISILRRSSEYFRKTYNIFKAKNKMECCRYINSKQNHRKQYFFQRKGYVLDRLSFTHIRNKFFYD